jgi:hypothetical protein
MRNKRPITNCAIVSNILIVLRLLPSSAISTGSASFAGTFARSEASSVTNRAEKKKESRKLHLPSLENLNLLNCSNQLLLAGKTVLEPHTLKSLNQ